MMSSIFGIESDSFCSTAALGLGALACFRRALAAGAITARACAGTAVSSTVACALAIGSTGAILCRE